MLWKTDIDNKIYEILTKNDKLYFNQILKEIYPYKKERRNQETLRIHLNEMVKQGILERNNLTIGKKRFYWLSEKTKFERELGIFPGIKNSSIDMEKIGMKRRAILIVLIFLSDVPTYKKIGKEYHDNESGFSPDDDENLDYYMDEFNIDFNQYRVDDIKESFSYFKENIPIMPIFLKGVIRFKINDQSLEYFLNFSAFVLYYLIRFVQEKFCVLNKRNKEEYEWLRLVRGEDYTNKLLSSVVELKRKKTTIKKRYFHFLEEKISLNESQLELAQRSEGELTGIDFLATEKKFEEHKRERMITYMKIMSQIYKIDSKDFQDVKIRYKHIYDIVKELIYPEFFRKIYKINFFEG